MWTFKRTLNNLNRTREIITKVVFYGFGRFVDETPLYSILGIGKRIITFGKSKTVEKLPEEVRFRKLLEELGPTFIKVGQFLSTRSDILPENFTNELKKLQDDVAPFASEDAIKKIEKSFNKKIDEIFADFSKEPIAAASIAQVHKATLKSGAEVAVKIKRPFIDEKIKTDLSILYFIAAMAEKYNQDARNVNLLDMVEEFADQLNKELNFVLEANYMDKFREHFRRDEYIKIPKIFWKYTNIDIITMEYIEGVSVDDIDILKKWNIDMVKLSEIGVDFYLRQVFEFGFFHADPHPGNFLVTKEGDIAILDFGIIGKVDKKLLEHLSVIFVGLINFDIHSLVEEMVSFGLIDRKANLRKIYRDLTDVILPLYGQNIGNVNVSLLFNDILTVGRKHSFKFPVDYLLIFKTFSFLESSGRKLNPNFNFLTFAEPYAKKILLKRLSPKYLFNEFKDLAVDYGDIFKNIPKDYSMIIDKIKNDDLSINFVHRNLDKMSKEIDRSANRLSFSIIIGATVLASSLFILADVGPKLMDISVFGLFGFLLASILGIGLIIGILRSGKL